MISAGAGVVHGVTNPGPGRLVLLVAMAPPPSRGGGAEDDPSRKKPVDPPRSRSEGLTSPLPHAGVLSTVPTIEDARIVLKQVFGYDGFRPGQEKVIEAVLEGRDPASPSCPPGPASH